MRKEEIEQSAKAFGYGVELAREAGFDAVELHAGHGYLISQFLSPSTNHRKDEFGGSLENRMRFMKMSVDEVLKAAKGDMAVLVKMNMRDCCRHGMELDESLEVAKTLESAGVHCLVLSSGFVSSAPMDVMRGAMPFRTMAYYMNQKLMPLLVRSFGSNLVPPVKFKEAYFLEDALKFRQALKMPLCYVGGLVSKDKIDEVLDDGFDFVAMARALLNNPHFVNDMQRDEHARVSCDHSNYCIGRMYSREMACHQCILREGRENIPQSLLNEIENNREKGY